jgi:3-isopropylmalate/(R)-2-methylmalate dehydratase small subunit
VNWLWEGRAWVFGDDVSNDEGLMPLEVTRKQIYDPVQLAPHCFEQVDAGFAREVKAGDFVVAGRNFGYGNPHIQGFLGLKGCGVGLLVESMSRGPLRACVNAGVPVLRIPGLRGFAQTGDRLAVDFEHGRVSNRTRNTVIETPPLPPVMREIIADGGGIGNMKRRLGISGAAG